MALTVNDERKSAVNVDKLAYAKQTADTIEELTYSTPVEIDKNLITAKYTPKFNSASQYASGQKVDGYTAKAGGTLDITVCATNGKDEVNLFGSKLDTTTQVITSNKDDIIPNQCVMYSTKRSDGTVNLYKFMKCKFTNQGETAQTTDENGITYNGMALQADYSATINNGNEMHMIKGVDPTTTEGTALISAWFATATGGLPTTS